MKIKNRKFWFIFFFFLNIFFPATFSNSVSKEWPYHLFLYMHVYLTVSCLFDLAMDPYVKIICEGEKVQSIVVNNEKNPKFGTKATFYRKKVDQPIIVEVCSAYQISMLLKELILRIYFLFFETIYIKIIQTVRVFK